MKLICSIGPIVKSVYDIENMLCSGMDIPRFNFSHISYEKSEKFIDYIQDKYKETKILGDIQGNKIRVSKIYEDKEIKVNTGQVIIFSTEDFYKKSLNKNNIVPIVYNGEFNDILEAKEILMKDGTMKFKIVERNKDHIKTQVVLGGIIRKEKGINAKGMRRKYIPLSLKDKKDIKSCLYKHLDIICLSYVTGDEELKEAREYIKSFENIIEDFKMPLIWAKVECREAFDKLDDIINESDGIILGRGDLKSEVDIEEIPILQSNITSKMKNSKKDLIIATYVLESLKRSQVPSISEVNDIFNFIEKGVNGFMLCGEVSISRYYLSNIEFMRNLVGKYTFTKE